MRTRRPSLFSVQIPCFWHRLGQGAAALLAVCGATTVAIPAAHAEVTLNGSWRQSALREEFTTSEWQSSCGPPPGTQTTGGGETVQVRREGDELSFIGGGRVYRTNACYDTMPMLTRDAHSRDATGRSFRTHCSTPPNDPRHGDVTTQVSATDRRIDIVETGRYESAVAEGKCAATVRRTRSYTLIAREGDDSPAPEPTTNVRPAPTAHPDVQRVDCTDPGEPARLEVHPAKKVLKPGDTFTFSARLVDAKGCPVKGELHWSSPTNARGIHVDARGTVVVAPEAPDGRTDLQIKAGDKAATVELDVASAENYDAFVKQEGLDINGELDTTASVALNGATVDRGEATAEDGSKRRRYVFLGILAAGAALLAGLLVAVLRRQRRARAEDASALAAHAARVAQVAARNEEKRAEYAQKVRLHEESVRAKERADAAYRAKVAEVSRSRNQLVRRCPSCAREFAAPTTFCPHDGIALLTADGAPLPTVPTTTLPTTTSATATAAHPTSKVCPKCGGTFPAETEFCGKDGGALVPVN